MNKIKLYVKIQENTGLQYFGRTKHCPFKYQGSGKIWKESLVKYGKNMSKSQIGKVREKVKCTYCGKLGAMNVMVRWHFENCKSKEGVNCAF